MARTTQRSSQNDLSLDAAMALLVQNQAAFVAQQVTFMNEMARIHKDLELIKAVLARHETMLEKLPEAIRDKIGFKN